MINIIAFDSLDTLGLRLFHVDSKDLFYLADVKADLCLRLAYVMYYYHVYCPPCTYDQKWSDVDCGVYEA